ncbi:MAG: hypothetical protein RDU13_03275 [Elusimicrobiales bacterium]|nr:hypothetical protein [Elusimicrobiales bacterium]
MGGRHQHREGDGRGRRAGQQPYGKEETTETFGRGGHEAPEGGREAYAQVAHRAAELRPQLRPRLYLGQAVHEEEHQPYAQAYDQQAVVPAGIENIFPVFPGSHIQFPLNSGLRFSMKAFIPSA